MWRVRGIYGFIKGERVPRVYPKKLRCDMYLNGISQRPVIARRMELYIPNTKICKDLLSFSAPVTVYNGDYKSSVILFNGEEFSIDVQGNGSKLFGRDMLTPDWNNFFEHEPQRACKETHANLLLRSFHREFSWNMWLSSEKKL